MIKKIVYLLLLVTLILPVCKAKAEGIDSMMEESQGSSLSGADGIFSQVFGENFNISGGTLNYLPSKSAVLVRDYAVITIQGRKIRARNIVFFTDTNKLYAEGDVSVVDPKGTFLNCEQLYFDIKDWKGRARKIRLRNEDKTVNTSDSVEERDVTLNRPTMAASSGLGMSDNTRDSGSQMDAGKIRMNLTATDMRMISKDHYEATNVTASPSNYARPHWSIASKSVQVRNGEKVEAFHNFIKIGKVPIFYFPYLIYDLQYDWPLYSTAAGSDSKQGIYWLNRLGWKFKNPEYDENGNKIVRFAQLDTIFADVDYRSNRGYGLGGELNYSVKGIGQGGTGHFRGYWTKEIYISNGDDIDRRNEDIEFNDNDWGNNKYYNKERGLYGDKNRYMIEWWHTQQITDEIDIRAQTHYFSDRDFLKEYFKDEWNQFNEKKTNATARYLGEHFVTELVAQGRINDFQSETDYMPEWRASLPGFKLFDLPLYIDSDMRAGLLRHRFDKELSELSQDPEYRSRLLNEQYRMKENGETPWIGRVYNKTELSAPFDLSILNIRPHAGGFLAGYSDGYDGNYGSTNDGKFNAALTWGVDFSTRFFGYFGSMRHMIEPTISVIGNETPVTDRTELYYLDDIDNYRKSHALDFNLYQQLDTKKDDGSTRRLARFTVKGGFILDDKEARIYNNNNSLKDLIFDGAVYPIESMSLFGDINYSFAAKRVSNATIGADYWFSTKLRGYLTHTYNSGYTPESTGIFGHYAEINSGESNITTAALRTQLWNKHSHYSLEYAVSYKWNDTKGYYDNILHNWHDGTGSGLQSQRFGLIRDLDTMELSASVIIDHLNNNNFSFYFNLTPKGWLGIQRTPDGGTATALDDNYGRYSRPVAEKMKRDDPGYNADTPAWD